MIKNFELCNDKIKLSNIVNEFKKYNVFDVITKISSLNILPENQNKSYIFDTIINSLLCNDIKTFNSNNIISPKKFKNLINACLELDIARTIDPIEMPFIQRVQFYGNKWIFSGINTFPGFIIQNFIDILFKHNNNYNPELLQTLGIFYEMILSISTNIVDKLEYSINTLQRYEKYEMSFPSISQFNKICDAITIKISDIVNLIGEDWENDLEIKFGKHNETLENDNYKFYYHPFLRISQENIIVLNPSMLIPFTISFTLFLAEKYNERDKIIFDYNQKVFNECKIYLKRLGHYKIQESCIGFECINTTNYKEILTTVANDGILFVRFFCDDGDNYKYNDMFGFHEIKLKELNDRIEELKNKVPEHAQNKIYQLVIINNFGRTISCSFDNKSDVGTVSLSPFELQCISINESNHKFFLPRYLQSKKSLQDSPLVHMAEYNYLSFFAENNYSFYSSDNVDVRKAMLMLEFGDSIDYTHKALKKDDKILVEYPNSNELKEIIINDDLRKIYYDTSKSQLSLINRYNNLYIWNLCNNPQSEIDLNIKISIMDLIAYWLSEFDQIINNKKFLVPSIIIQHNILGSAEDFIQIKSANNHTFNNLLDIKKTNDYTIEINWTPEMFHVFVNNENRAEKELLKIIIEHLSLFTERNEVLQFDDSIFNNPLKTKMFSLDVQKHPYLKPIIGDIPVIPNECVDKLLYDIGDFLIKDKKMNYGIIDNSKNEVCKEIVNFLYNKLKTELSNYNLNGIYERIYYDLEIIMYKMMLIQKRYISDIACYPEKIDILEKQYNNLNESSMALKFLLEYVSATPPSGKIQLSEMDYEYLLSLCSLITEWAHISDLFHTKMIDNDLEILKSGRIGFEKNNVERLAQNNLNAIRKKLSAISNPYAEVFSAQNTIKIKDLDNAYLHEYGYSFTQFSNFITTLIDIGDTIENEVKSDSIENIIMQISEKTNLDSLLIDKILNDLSLSQRINYLKPEPPFDCNDVYPWRFNRRLSLNRRPIIKHGAKIIWGNRQLYHSLLFTYDIIDDGRFKANSKEMKQFIGQVAHKRGNCFNDKVFDKVIQFNNLIVRKNLKKINGIRLANEKNKDLGDIDLLIINPQKKKIIVVETKDFSFAKTPHELHQQYVNIFCDTDNKSCYITKHKKRVNWVNNHIHDIIKEFNLSEGKWKVDDLLITSEPIISNEFYNQKQKILLFSEIDDGGINRI